MRRQIAAAGVAPARRVRALRRAAGSAVARSSDASSNAPASIAVSASSRVDRERLRQSVEHPGASVTVDAAIAVSTPTPAEQRRGLGVAAAVDDDRAPRDDVSRQLKPPSGAMRRVMMSHASSSHHPARCAA